MAFKSLGFTNAVKNFYNFLNEWGIGLMPEDVQTIDTHCFSNEEAIKGEQVLTEHVAKLSLNLDDVRDTLN